MLQHTPKPDLNTLKMEAGSSSETSRHTYPIGCKNPKDGHLGTPAMVTWYLYSFCTILSLSEVNKISLKVVHRQIVNTLHKNRTLCEGGTWNITLRQEGVLAENGSESLFQVFLSDCSSDCSVCAPLNIPVQCAPRSVFIPLLILACAQTISIYFSWLPLHKKFTVFYETSNLVTWKWNKISTYLCLSCFSAIVYPEPECIPYINLLKTKHNLLYIRNRSVPRSEHFPSLL